MFGIPSLVGLALLLAGRRLFWLFVGAAGFIYGLTLGRHLFPGQPETLTLALAIVLGIVGALLALFLQKLAIGLAGAAFGAYLLRIVAESLGYAGNSIIIAMIIGAVIGAILVAALFEWALILLSSFAGAVLIVESLRLERGYELLAVAVLALVGVTIQARMARRRRGLLAAVP